MICELALSTAMTCGRWNSTRGESEAAIYIAEQARKRWEEVKQTHSVGGSVASAVEELFDVASSAAEPNWNGYGAAAVSHDTYRHAYCFLDSLPLGLPVPSVGVEADGQLTFEWYRNPSRTLSVSVSADGDLHYAALIGLKKEYGTEIFIGDFPDRFVNLLRDLCA
jgi:hypothetical protein